MGRTGLSRPGFGAGEPRACPGGPFPARSAEAPDAFRPAAEGRSTAPLRRESVATAPASRTAASPSRGPVPPESRRSAPCSPPERPFPPSRSERRSAPEPGRPPVRGTSGGRRAPRGPPRRARAARAASGVGVARTGRLPVSTGAGGKACSGVSIAGGGADRPGPSTCPPRPARQAESRAGPRRPRPGAAAATRETGRLPRTAFSRKAEAAGATEPLDSAEAAGSPRTAWASCRSRFARRAQGSFACYWPRGTRWP